MKLEKLSNFLLLIVARTKTMRKTNTRLLIGLKKELQFISSLIKLINILKCDEQISWQLYVYRTASPLFKNIVSSKNPDNYLVKNVPADF